MGELLSVSLRRRAQESQDPTPLLEAADEVEAFEQLLGERYTHQCVRCCRAYTPVTENENCPACGCDGTLEGTGAPGESPKPAPPATPEQIEQLRGLDTDQRVRFYEHDFYVLSNFSAFSLVWRHLTFATSEAAYHYEKFSYIDSGGVCSSAEQNQIASQILKAPSAHEAFKIAERHKALRRPDWDAVKFDVMLRILRAKVSQHEYVRRKLLATGDRELVEDSWRDDVWGWGPHRTGQNMLGRLWMQVRDEIRKAAGLVDGETPIEPPWGERERYRFVNGTKVYRTLGDYYDL